MEKEFFLLISKKNIPVEKNMVQVAPQSSAPYHHRPHRHPELTIQKVETIDTLIAITTTFQRYR